MSDQMLRKDCRSDEEWSMILWLQEAKAHGLVEMWEYEPKKFTLFEKMDYKFLGKKCNLYPAKGYTPDFVIQFTKKGLGLFIGGFKKSFVYPYADNTIFIDTKGKFHPHGGTYFYLCQRVMFERYGFWVDKVVPFYTTGKKKARKGLFVDTFAPESLRFKPVQGGLNVIGRNCKPISEFVRTNAELF